MAKVELKAPIVDEIKGYVSDAKSAVLVDYRGLTVEQDTKLRKQLREAGVVYKVYKNTMLHLAFDGTDFAQLDKDLEGPTAIAFGIEDETAPARIINNFAKEAEALEIKSGVVDGEYYDAAGVKVLATIPSRRAYFQVAWKPTVTNHELCSCRKTDCRSSGRNSSRISYYYFLKFEWRKTK